MMTRLIHPELSYEVRGVLLHVYNTLGPMLKEEYYEQAIAIGLDKRRIRHETQKTFEVYYEDEPVGLYRVDVWIEDGKILLEIKVAPGIQPVHKAQAISYLKVSHADLAMVVNFGGASLEDERLPNFLHDGHTEEFVWQSSPTTEGLLYPDLTDAIRRACHRVHFVLGPGYLHQVYRRAAMIELRRSGLSYEYLKRLPVEYDGVLLGYQDTRLILVEGKVLLATFALRETDDSIAEQLKARMRLLNVDLGLLANFYGTKLTIASIRIG